MAKEPESKRAAEGNTRQDLGQAELGYCERHAWLHAKDSGPTPPCRNWTAGRGEGLAGLREQVEKMRDAQVAEAKRYVASKYLYAEYMAGAKALEMVLALIGTALEAAAPPSTAHNEWCSIVVDGQECVLLEGHDGPCERSIRGPQQAKSTFECGCITHGEAIQPCARHLLFWRAALATPSPQAPATLADHCERCKAGQRREYRTVVMPEPYGGIGWWHWSPNAVWAVSKEKGAWFTCQVQSAPPTATQEQPAGSGADIRKRLEQLAQRLRVFSCPSAVVSDDFINGWDAAKEHCAERIESILRNYPESGSPRKVGEDGPLKYGDVVWVPATVIRVFDQQLNVGIHRLGPNQHSYYAVLDKNEIVRPSSVPAGEPKS